ncbi:DUF2829 domain-containing protein [Levilactobacillus andaensis]|uniref:DUF2829 domain-containing protein n=1 Tax=Levilactobacillus andaensis TaxID=2799570 RepID=UPI001943689B|nr:DUF2829 domain-containing protein [Levilactobacillus andaensis]
MNDEQLQKAIHQQCSATVVDVDGMDCIIVSISAVGNERYLVDYSPVKPAVRHSKKEDVKTMDFSKALKLLKQGKRLRRKGWNGKGIFIKLRTATANSDMSHDFIYIDTTGLQTDNQGAPKDRVPWLASQTDMLANDWEVADSQYLNRFSADEYLLGTGNKMHVSPKITVNVDTDHLTEKIADSISKAVSESLKKAAKTTIDQLGLNDSTGKQCAIILQNGVKGLHIPMNGHYPDLLLEGIQRELQACVDSGELRF